MLRQIAFITFAASLPLQPASAGPAADALGQCFVQYTSPQDRVDLVQWIGTAIAAHPSISPVISTNTDMLDQLDRNMAALLTRLMIEDCLEELKYAVAVEGEAVFMQSGEIMGRIAMQDIMTSPAVTQRIEGFTSHLDADAIDAAFD